MGGKPRSIAQRRKDDKAERESAQVKVLCGVCSEFFMTPKQCLECSNWNICLECLRKESEETLAILRSKGIDV